jgi:hypothetical protein
MILCLGIEKQPHMYKPKTPISGRLGKIVVGSGFDTPSWHLPLTPGLLRKHPERCEGET